jgi:hypothetical protein
MVGLKRCYSATGGGVSSTVRPIPRSVDDGPVGVVWIGGVAPTLATSGYTHILLWKVGSTVYGKHGGICLETQKYPDSIHHADWPSTRLDPGQTYRHTMVHRFGTR